MKLFKTLVAFVFLDFLALTAYVLYQYGPIGWIPELAANPVTVLITVDLVIALTVAVGWTWRDARERGVSPLPYAVLTALTGSVGILLYILNRPVLETVAQE